LPFHVFVAGIGDLALRHPARLEGRVELDAKPLPELAMIRERAPDPCNRCLEFDALFDAIGHVQPPGCFSLCPQSGKCATFLLHLLPAAWPGLLKGPDRRESKYTRDCRSRPRPW